MIIYIYKYLRYILALSINNIYHTRECQIHVRRLSAYISLQMTARLKLPIASSPVRYSNVPKIWLITLYTKVELDCSSVSLNSMYAKMGTSAHKMFSYKLQYLQTIMALMRPH